MHRHEPAPARSLQTALIPHGDGLHGIGTSGGIRATGFGLQFEKGSPEYPSEHRHIGLWFTTEQIA